MNGGTNAIIKDSRIQMLQDAMIHVDCILQKRLQDNQITHRITLLEGELVGALTMKIVIGNAIVALEGDEDGTLIGEIEAAMTNLLLFGRKYILSEVLAPSECEVLYGRCGYLKGRLVVRMFCCTVAYTRQVHSDKKITCFVLSSYQIHSDRDR